MQDRLDDLDDELALTEAALQSLEADLATWPQTDADACVAPSSAPAPRFQCQISCASNHDLKPERADPVVRRTRPGYSFSRSGARSDSKPACISEGSMAGAVKQETRSTRPSSCGQGLRTPSTTRCTGMTIERAPRWGSVPSREVERRIRAKLTLDSDKPRLGVTFDKRHHDMIISYVNPDSPVGRWNARQLEADRPDLQALPGDVIVQLGHQRITCVSDLRAAFAACTTGFDGLAEIDLVLLRPISALAMEVVPKACDRTTDLQPKICLQEKSKDTKRPGEITWAEAVAAAKAVPRPDVKHSTARRPASGTHVSRSRVDNGDASRAPISFSLPAQISESLQSGIASQGLVPGRYCGKVQPSLADALGQCKLASGSWKEEQLKPAVTGTGPSCTFGGEARFAVASRPESSEQIDPIVLCPNDRFLSTKPAQRSTVIMPLPAKQKALHIKKKTGADLVGYAKAPGLRGVLGAWLALVRELLIVEHGGLEEASTEVGSDGTESSVMSSGAWSDATTCIPSEVPGPGAYSPDFAVGKMSTTKGTPSFARYSAREPRARSAIEVELSGDSVTTHTDSSYGTNATRISEISTRATSPRTIGGLITPLPSSRPKALTIRQSEEKLASRRPFYDPNTSAIDAEVPSISFGEQGQKVETGRLERLRKLNVCGPGSYDIQSLVPGGRAAFILPEPTSHTAAVRAKTSTPGPAQYDCSKSMSLVYPRAKTADFRASLGHTMGFQRVPRYVLRYSALQPRWEAVKRRCLSVMILPIHSSTRAVEERPEPGPGDYRGTDCDRLVRRVRPDFKVTRWMRPGHGVCEHEHALFDPRPVDSAVRGDPRAMLGLEYDFAVRRRHPSATIHPLSQSLPAKVHSDGHWKFYDPLPPSSPEGLASFSRRIDFENFRYHEAMWRAREERAQKHRSQRLAYSLPALEVTKSCAPSHDFGRLQGRPASDPGDVLDSPREGDVLLLSTGAERDLFHPRNFTLVNMARQVGRAQSSPPALGSEVDDFEELILDPQPVGRRSPICYVDMARSRGRGRVKEEFQPNLSAHLWADDNGVLYAWQPTAGLRLRDPEDDELQLSPRWEHVRRSSPQADFSRALGRPGVDFRVREHEFSVEEEAIMTNWQPSRYRGPPADEVRGLQGQQEGAYRTAARPLERAARLRSRSPAPRLRHTFNDDDTTNRATAPAATADYGTRHAAGLPGDAPAAAACPDEGLIPDGSSSAE